jgi:hypothetical protein
MQHLTEEQLVAHYYHDADAPAGAVDHLRECSECRTQFETIQRVLSLVNAAPVPDRGEDYGSHVWNRLRWKLGRNERRFNWAAISAIAAAVAMAFFAGLLWRSRPESHPVTATIAHTTPAIQPVATTTEDEHAEPKVDRVLLYVVSDHLESSERVLLEVVNATPGRAFDNSNQQKRAEDLVSANRLYRQTALQKGDDRLADLLADLEPVLIDLSHAGTTIRGDELRDLQQRIETRSLLFKVRVISAQTGGGGESAVPPAGTQTL